MTQAQLAEQLHICQQAVAKWEKGVADPKWELAPKIAKALGCGIGDLFTGASA